MPPKSWEKEVDRLWDAVNNLTNEISQITTEIQYMRKGLSWIIAILVASLGIDVGIQP